MSFDNIKLEKGLYTAGKGFTKALEELDPSENYRGTELEGLDAYQRQLKRFDIKVSGRDSDTVSKFFQTSDSAALFPEYISRAVRQGIEENDILSKIISTTTNIDSLDYRAIELVNAPEEKDAPVVLEGTHIPEAVIKTKESLTKLKKRGRMLVASYEAVKFQKLDVFTIMLKRIGQAISRAQLIDAIEEVSSADIEILSFDDPGSISYSDLIKLWNSFSPYTLTTMLCGADTLAKILAMPEFRDAAAGLNFHATGTLVTPLGAELLRFDHEKFSAGILGLDKNYAIEKVQTGEVMTDFDKLIDRQLERASVTAIAGFSTMFPGAVKAIG